MVHCEGNKPMTFGTTPFKQSRSGLSSRGHNFPRVRREPCRGRVTSPWTGSRPIRSRIMGWGFRKSAAATATAFNNSFTLSSSLSTVCAVRVTASQRDGQAGPIASEFGFSHHLSLDGAIARSQNFLLREQKREGYWVGELMVDSTLVSDTIAYHHWNGKVDPVWERKAVHHLFSLQLADGGWNIYYGGPAEVNATIKAYLALKLAGVPVTDPRMLHARDLALPRDPQRFTLRNFFLWLDRFHKWIERSRLRPFRKLALRKAETWMLERFEGSDGLAAIFPAMLNSLIALKALGYPDHHPEVRRAEHELKKLELETETEVRIEPCFSPVWDTAIVTIALRESGLPGHHPALQQAVDWLVIREIRFRGDWAIKNPAKVEPSGWVFEFNNKWNPDVDDTAMVLLALRKIPTDDPRRRDDCFQRGLRWMLAFQCRDGGWASFDKDCTKGVLEKVPFADHNAMLDPECADITARILELLGYEGFDVNHRKVKAALQFIREHQEADGSWYGRWGVNYIYGTWQVLRGLRALNLNMDQPWLLKARDWLESVQHEDGGWGERCNTYDDPVFKGQGPSTASQTAWAVMGLLAFDDPYRPSVQRGIAYLIHNQNLDGSWTEHETTGTGFPRVFYLKYDMYRNSWPLLALGTYRNLLHRLESSVNGPLVPLPEPRVLKT